MDGLQSALRDGTFNGIFCGMNTTIDRAGRLVVPKSIRKAAHLEPGTRVRIRLVDGLVQIEPLPLSVTLERSGRMVVAVPTEDKPELTASEVDETLMAVRTRAASPQIPE